MSTKSEESRELKSLRAQVRRLEAANEEIEHLRNAFDALVVAHATSKSQRQEIASTLRNQLRDSHHQAESKAGQLEDARNVVKALAQCSRGEGLRQLEQHLWDAKLAKEMETSKCSNLERRLGEKEIGLGLVWKALQDSEHQREELTEALSQSQKELHSQRASQQQDWDMFKKERKTWYAATQERTQESQMALKHLRDELTFTKDRLKTSEQFSSVNELYLLGQMQATQADLHFVQLELQQARSTISNIEGKNTSLKSELKQEKSDKATTQASLEASQTEVHRLTSELDAEKSQRTQDWESMQQRIDAVDQQRQTQVQRAVKAEEALGKAQKEMVLIRAKEQDLEEQVESWADVSFLFYDQS